MERTPVLPEPTRVRALPAQLRRLPPRSAMSGSRRLLPSGQRTATVLQAVKFDPKAPLERGSGAVGGPSPERRVVLGSANSPSQSGDVDAVARAVVGALLDVTRHAHVALD